MEVGLKEATAEREEEMRETRGERLVYRTRWHEGAMAQVRIRWCKLCRALGGAEVVGATGPRSCSTRHKAAFYKFCPSCGSEGMTGPRSCSKRLFLQVLSLLWVGRQNMTKVLLACTGDDME